MISDKLIWSTEQRTLGDLIPYEHNPRGLTEKEYTDLRESLEKFGLVEIPAIDKDGIICSGHQRLKVLVQLEGPEYKLDVRVPHRKMTREEFQEYNIRANKNTGHFDFDVLANAFDIDDLETWGFTEAELVGLDEKEPEVPEAADAAPDKPQTARTKPGDLYELGGRHRVLCGDAMKKADVEALMDGKTAEMVYTDPPYGVSYESTDFDKMENDDLRGEGLEFFLTAAFKRMNENTKANPAVYVWHASRNQMTFETALIEAGFEVKEQLIWKKGMVLGRSDYHWSHEPLFYARKQGNNNEWFGDRKHKTMLREENIDFSKYRKDQLIQIIKQIQDDSTVWEMKKDSVREYKHPTQKPVDLAVRAMINSTIMGKGVLDLFLGSGTTVIASEIIKRRCFGMEIDPLYCDIIVERYVEYTKDRNIKLNGEDTIW